MIVKAYQAPPCGEDLDNAFRADTIGTASRESTPPGRPSKYLSAGTEGRLPTGLLCVWGQTIAAPRGKSRLKVTLT